MHEFSVIENIFTLLDKVAKENRLTKITKVALKVGRLRQLQEETLCFAFETIAKDSLAEGASLIVDYVPVEIRCAACGEESLLEKESYVCPRCHAVSVQVVRGQDLVLEHVEGDR